MKMKRLVFCLILIFALICSSALAVEDLSRGSNGAWVVALQLRLDAMGYSVGTTDGSFGGKTESAVKQFQAEHGLPETGTVDDATWAALYDERVTIEQSGVKFSVKLTPPFDTIALQEDSASAANLKLAGENSATVEAYYVAGASMGDLIEALEMILNETYDGFVTSNQAHDNLMTSTTIDVNGKEAGLIINSYGLVNEKPMTHYVWVGVLPMIEDTFITATVVYNIDEDSKSYFKGLYSNNTVKDILSAIEILDD